MKSRSSFATSPFHCLVSFVACAFCIFRCGLARLLLSQILRQFFKIEGNKKASPQFPIKTCSPCLLDRFEVGNSYNVYMNVVRITHKLKNIDIISSAHIRLHIECTLHQDKL